MKRSAVALIDGEHYPPVVVEALRKTSDRFEYRAAVFLGGSEKIRSADLRDEAEGLYGLPVVFGEEVAQAHVVQLQELGIELDLHGRGGHIG